MVMQASAPSLTWVYQSLSILVAPVDAPMLNAMLPKDFAAVTLVRTDRAGLIIEDDGREVVLPILPPLCLGLVAASDQGLAHLRACVTAAGVDIGAPQPIFVDPHAGAFGLVMATNLAKRFRAQCEATATLAREQSKLRAMHEDMLNAFAELETFVSDNGLQSAQLDSESLPGTLPPVGGPAVQEVKQVLPVSIARLCALEFHIDDLAQTEGFVATLSTREDSVAHCEWRFSRSELSDGWRTLQLPKGIVGPPRTAELRLRAADREAGLPMLSLGAPVPHSLYRVASEDGNARHRAGLAFRVWKGLPGVRPPRQAGLADSPAVRLTEASIPFTLIKKLKLVPGPRAPTFEVLEMRPAIKGFLLHPGTAGSVTLAAWDGLDISEPSRLTAKICVESPDANPIEFAMGLSPLPDNDVREMFDELQGAANYPDFAFSGWRRVIHGEQATVSLDLLRNKGRVFCATRMADGAPEWFGWATFGDFRQTYLGAEAITGACAHATGALAQVEGPSSEKRSEIDVSEWLSRSGEHIYRAATNGISCPAQTVAPSIRRLPRIEYHDRFAIEATVRQSHDHPGAEVEFAIAVTDLGVLGALARATNKGPVFDDGRFAFSGWISIAEAAETKIMLAAENLSLTHANVYLLTQLGGGSADASVPAFFENISARPIRLAE